MLSEKTNLLVTVLRIRCNKLTSREALIKLVCVFSTRHRQYVWKIISVCAWFLSHTLSCAFQLSLILSIFPTVPSLLTFISSSLPLSLSFSLSLSYTRDTLYQSHIHQCSSSSVHLQPWGFHYGSAADTHTHTHWFLGIGSSILSCHGPRYD